MDKEASPYSTAIKPSKAVCAVGPSNSTIAGVALPFWGFGERALLFGLGVAARVPYFGFGEGDLDLGLAGAPCSLLYQKWR